MPATPTGTERLAEVRRLTEEMDALPVIADGHFSAMGMLVTDASLAADEPALEAAQNGLQWLVHRQAGQEVSELERSETRGRLLGLIDVTHWALRRLPSGLQLSLDPNSHAARFMLAVAASPGLSNQDLCDRLGVDQTEVSRIGRRLLAAGVVWRRREWRRNVWDVTPRGRHYLETSPLAEAARAQPGPPRDGTPTHVVGVQVRPGHVTGVLVDRGADRVGEAVDRALPEHTDGPAAVTAIAGLVRDLLRQAPSLDPARVSVGVAVGGHVRTESGTVVSAPGYGWSNVSLRDPLSAELGMPVVVENDANALTELERAVGELTGIDDAAVVLITDGVGCGLVINGALTHGAGGSAGEIGHLVVDPEGDEERKSRGHTCVAGHYGCLETATGVEAVFEQVKTEWNRRDMADLPEAAMLTKSQDLPVDTFRRAGAALGRSLSAVQNLVNPQKIVLYGPAELVCGEARAGEVFVGTMLHTMQEHAFSNADTDCNIKRKPYAATDGARAAAVVALRRTGEVSPR